jgi:hypothetical protein
MATVHSILTNFTAGEISPRVYGRVDLAKYQNGARELTNVTVLPQGGARKRGGTLNVSNIKDNNPDAILVPFVFSTTQAYMIEFGPGYIRFFKDRGIIYDVQYAITAITHADNATVTAPGHTFKVGDRIIITNAHGMEELNNREFTVLTVGTDFFTIGVNSNDYTIYTGGGTVSRVYEIATYFTASDVATMTFTQSADTLYIFSDNWPIQLLKRYQHAFWTLTTGNIEEGPWLDLNTDLANTMSLDVASGGAILTASKPIFQDAHVGALFRIWEQSTGDTFGYATWAPGANVTVGNNTFWEYKGNVYYVVSGGGGLMASTATYPTHTQGTVDIFYGTNGEVAQMRYEHSGYCIAQITHVVNTQNANATIYYKYRTPYTAYGGRSSPQWQEGAWSDLRGYPTTGTFHEQRLVTANTANQPTTLWGSMLNAYLNYKDGDKADQSYNYTISSDQVDAIKFMSTTKRLVVNATSGEYTVAASNTNEAITSTNIKISRETSFGIANVKPVRAGPAILFAQRRGWNQNPARRLRELVYNFQTDSYVAPDLTILSEHITAPGILQGAYVAGPDLMIWYVRADGEIVAMTYERDQQVVGWHHHILGGDGFAEHIASIPGSDNDELWMIVERLVGAEKVRHVVVGMPGLNDGDPLEDAFYLDNALQYDGDPTNVISGLWHLNGDSVSALADGVPLHDLPVMNGRITFNVPASKVTVGYRYTARIRTLHIEAGAQGGTSQGQIGRVFEITARLQNSIGGTYGTDLMNANGVMDPIPYRSADAPLDTAVPLFNGDKRLPFDGEWDRDRYIVIEHDEPLPFTLTALIVGHRISG